LQLGVPTSARFAAFSDYILTQQQRIIATLEAEEEQHQHAAFAQDPWEKRSADVITAGGVTAVLQGGNLLEKGAVSTTITTGTLTEERARAISSRSGSHPNVAAGRPYAAAALSLVLHSRSPMVPTFRSDVRYFEVAGSTSSTGDAAAAAAWFGGGADLTPYYLFDEDAHAFHGHYRALCDAHAPGGGLYPRLKVATHWYRPLCPPSLACRARPPPDHAPSVQRECDEYFFIPARGEHRGVGGIFFDDLSALDEPSSSSSSSGTGRSRRGLDEAMAFTQAVCEAWMPSYLPIVRQVRPHGHLAPHPTPPHLAHSPRLPVCVCASAGTCRTPTRSGTGSCCGGGGTSSSTCCTTAA
jgi:coproporphyrinogen III oxidase